jgi:hypothetical protein
MLYSKLSRSTPPENSCPSESGKIMEVKSSDIIDDVLDWAREIPGSKLSKAIQTMKQIMHRNNDFKDLPLFIPDHPSMGKTFNLLS